MSTIIFLNSELGIERKTERERERERVNGRFKGELRERDISGARIF